MPLPHANPELPPHLSVKPTKSREYFFSLSELAQEATDLLCGACLDGTQEAACNWRF
jgi:hypothetical protein